MSLKPALVGLLFFLACGGAGVAATERPDIPLKSGTVVPKARITGIETDKLIVISEGQALTIHRSEISDDYAKTIDWPKPREQLRSAAPAAPKEITSATPSAPTVKQAPKPTTPVVSYQPRPDPIPPEPKIIEDLSPFAPFTGEKNTTVMSRKLRGQCFVVTRGGTNFKLGDVKIRIFGRKEYVFFKAQASERSTAFNDAWGPRQKALSARGEYDGSLAILRRQLAYMETLDELMPESVSEFTDADGKFEFSHNVDDPFFVVARAQRLVGDETEKYRWVIESKDIPASGQLMLSNRNMQ